MRMKYFFLFLLENYFISFFKVKIPAFHSAVRALKGAKEQDL